MTDTVPTQIDNPRFENVSGDFTYEAVAPRIEINWDPQKDTGTVLFWVELEEYLNGVYQGRKPHKHWAMRPLSVSLEELAKVRGYELLLPDGTTMAIPPGVLGLLVKTCFNDVFGERVLELPAINNDLPESQDLPPPVAPPEPIGPGEDPLFQEPAA